MSFISLKVSGGVSIILEAYIKGDSASVLTIVIFPLIDCDLCFQILGKFVRVAIFWFEVEVKIVFMVISYIYISRVSRRCFYPGQVMWVVVRC